MNARGKSWASVNGSLEASLLNLSRCNKEEGGRDCGIGADLCRGMKGVSSVDSPSNEEEVGSSLFPMKETDHSLSPIYGLALVALVLTYHGMAKGGTDAHGSATSWAFFAFLGAGSSGATTFRFWRATHTSPSPSSLVSLMPFNLCATGFIAGGLAGANMADSCLLLVWCSYTNNYSSSSSFTNNWVCSSLPIRSLHMLQLECPLCWIKWPWNN